MAGSADNVRLVQYSLTQIEQGMRSEQYARALAHFCIVFKLQPALKEEMKDKFLLAAARHTARLESEEKWRELLDCYEELLKANDGCGELYHWLGTLLFRRGHAAEAVSTVAKALELGLGAARSSLEGIRLALLERWHFPMLNDEGRNGAFATAIAAAVRDQGHGRVLDIGTGTGLLGLFALGAGAEEVYACEVCPVSCATARAVFRANGFEAKVINKHSTRLTIPGDLDQRVSLVVTETFDAGLLGEGALPNLLHAWENLLDRGPTGPGPRVIPDGAQVFVCLLECEAIRRQTRYPRGRQRRYKLRYERVPCRVGRAAREALGMARVERRSRGPYTTARLGRLPGGYRALSRPRRILSLDFNDYQALKDLSQRGPWREEVECSRAGRLDAVCLWFRLQVGDKWLDTMQEDTCWEQAIYRASSAPVEEGDAVGLTVTCGDHVGIGVESRRSIAGPAVRLPGRAIRVLNECAVPLSEVASSVRLPPGARILDVSSVPLLGLLLLEKDATRHLTTVEGCSPELVSAFLEAHALENHRWVPSVDALSRRRDPRFDVLVTDVWDASGNLRPLLLETVALLRLSCLKPGATVLPTAWSVHAALVESPTLEAQSRLLSDRRTMGWKVAACLNGWARVSHHQDICLSTLPHRELCAPLELFRTDLTRETEVPATKHRVAMLREGRISACPFWFEAHYPDGKRVGNLTGRGLFRQAAVVFARPARVKRGQRVTLAASCTDGRLAVELEVADASAAACVS